MLLPCRIHVVTTVNDIRSLYAVYSCLDENETVRYVGVSPLSELFTLRDAYSNTEFANTFNRQITTLEIRVDVLTATEKEAYIEQRRLIGVHNPTCNRHGYHVETNKQGVTCNETGEHWKSAQEAATAHGLTYSALINHLNRKPGFKTVKGRTYLRQVKHDI